MKAEGVKSELMSVSTKAESYRIQRSMDSKRYYPRPRTNSPFPPIRNRTSSKQFKCVKQSESFNSSLHRNINETSFESKPNTNTRLREKFKILNRNKINYEEAKESMNNDYNCEEMIAPLNEGSFSIQINKLCRNNRNSNENNQINILNKRNNSNKIHVRNNSKNYISWKSIVIHSNDLNKIDREKLGFSPSSLNHENSDDFKGKQNICVSFDTSTNKISKDISCVQVNKTINDYLPEFSKRNINLNKTYK